MRSCCLALLLPLALFLSLPLSVQAYEVSDFTFYEPGLTVRLVLEEDIRSESFATQTAAKGHNILAGGSLLVQDKVPSPPPPSPPFRYLRLSSSGELQPVFEVPETDAFGCGPGSQPHSDPAEGIIWYTTLGWDGSDCGLRHIWIIEGLPRTQGAGACPEPPGDLAPGELDEGTEPPTWRPTGDGSVNVGDVIALMRAAVGLQTIDCGP